MNHPHGLLHLHGSAHFAVCCSPNRRSAFWGGRGTLQLSAIRQFQATTVRHFTREEHLKASMADRRVLITFDVDGTLMHSTGLTANRLHKFAFSHAFKQVFNIDGTIDAIKHHGSTDPAVLINTLEHYGVPKETAVLKLPELKAKMLEYAIDHANEVGEGLELLPGVAHLLQLLSKRQDVVVGLVTGNLETIAWLKMGGLGIRSFFSVPNFGGFGSDHIYRGELVKVAARRADQYFPGGFLLQAHVGDTPNDISASEYGGAQAIGVCTGIFSKDELLAASSGQAIILDNLVCPDQFFKACGLTTL